MQNYQECFCHSKCLSKKKKKKRLNTFRTVFGLGPLARSTWGCHKSCAWKHPFLQSDKMRFPVILGLKDFKQSLKPIRLSLMGFEINSRLEAMISCTSSCFLHCGSDPLHENIFFWSTVSEISRTYGFKDTDFVVSTVQNKGHIKNDHLHRARLVSPQNCKMWWNYWVWVLSNVVCCVFRKRQSVATPT